MNNLNLKEISGYKIQLVADRIWAIDEYGTDIIYLVEGSEKNLLVDTGAGFGPLRATVKQLSAKPCFVVNTHGHFDHAFGNDEFDETYMCEDDFPLLKSPYLTLEKWQTFCRKAMSEAAYTGPDVWDKPLPEIRTPVSANEGQCFELGDRSFEIIKVPGHTAGSIALLDTKNRVLITGDSVVSTPVLIFDTYSATVREYQSGLESLLRREKDFDMILPGHFLRPIGKMYLWDLFRCAQDILSKTAKPELVNMSHISQEPAFLYRKGFGSIIYNDRHISATI